MAINSPSSHTGASPPSRTYLSARPLVLGAAKVLTIGLTQLPTTYAFPIQWNLLSTVIAEGEEEPPMEPNSPTLWIYLAVAIGLVLLGGAFAGLTIALMGQDEIYLQVIKTSGESYERRHAGKVLGLLQRGKHWVLVTLLLGNVITNETLPIVLDRSLGGGWPAVLGSTVLIVIFGEIIPQSVCVRYGLPIGAWMSPLVLILMWILAPVAWPTAKLLDWLLGEDHGTTYKKAGLKTLVTLHKSLGAAGEQLNEDEVTIISAVLDLKAKPVGNIMTPMSDVFTMSADTVLDEKTMEIILSAGYSRIPIYQPENPNNFVGMLLVRILITYDPEDARPVRDFALATLPETAAETSCLDIVNFFQEGKSHMVLVSEYPGEDHGAMGVVTLEDVIEELIGEEIIDESDVFIDVAKSIRRSHPAPKARVPKGVVVTDPDNTIANGEENLIELDHDKDRKDPDTAMRRTPRPTEDGHVGKANGTNVEPSSSPARRQEFRRTSSVANASDREGKPRTMDPAMRERLKHLGPSNIASRPRQTRYNTVKIKPGAGSLVDGFKDHHEPETPRRGSTAAQGGVGAGLVNSAGKEAKDGVLALQAGYGTIVSPTSPSAKSSRRIANEAEDVRQARMDDVDEGANSQSRRKQHSRTTSQSTLGSMHSGTKGQSSRRGPARSGSITENTFEAGGIKKTVLEMTSSSEDAEAGGVRTDGVEEVALKENERPEGQGGGGRKKRRRKKRKPSDATGEEQGLLGKDRD